MDAQTLFNDLFPNLRSAITQISESQIPVLRNFGAEDQAAALEAAVQALLAALDADDQRVATVAEAAAVVRMDRTSLHHLVSEGRIPAQDVEGDRRVRVLDAVAYRLMPRKRRHRSQPDRAPARDRVIAREVVDHG
jgi:hypothetical protein